MSCRFFRNIVVIMKYGNYFNNCQKKRLLFDENIFYVGKIIFVLGLQNPTRTV